MRASAISKPALLTLAMLLLCSAANALQGAHSSADLNAADLDAIVQKIIAQERVVGASVLVARGDRILLHKGYGFADLGLEAPAKDETVYHVVGPMLPFTGIAVMQQVERGKLSLDDDISKFIPEFPLQGHHVTVRQLLNHTSGIVDYHYLGDPIEATSRQPKALDEVMALYAGKNWVNEPGTKWDWSISGFNLLVTIVERVTGQSLLDYVQQNIFKPAGVKSTTYCDDFTLTRGLAHAYRKTGAGSVTNNVTNNVTNYVEAHENGMAYNSDLRFCSTVGDLLQLWRAIKEKALVRPETFKQMTTAEGAAAHMSAQDPKAQYGFAMILNHEEGLHQEGRQQEDHRRIGQHGSLMGYSGSLYDFPEDNLTIVVLTNTEDQNAYAITRALGRAILGLPALPTPKREAEPALADKPISADERKQLAGTFVLKLGQVGAGANLHDSFAQYRRTYRVFDENGRLMIQPLGEGPERLLKQDDGSFAMRSSAASHISFVVQNGHATTMKLDSPGFPLAGERVGDGSAATFHGQLK
ncbi:MAG TPA: serine hydrolase domain-containing protein [Candidatus Dormibacteraeota bacterium]|jgi:D-alanyl-D-alanine carboxypeptidase|nr:serine hydrolase domain-containing protein [Candidatus Dormibacteraeota bacterium]